MEGILNVTPEQLISTATDFQGKGNTVSSLTSEMMSLVTGLSSAWEGEAKTAYVTKFQMLEDDIQKMINMVTEHVNDLNDMARSYQEAESKNVEEAGTLSGDVIV
jgi:WXG100 family type VII secretion target